MFSIHCLSGSGSWGHRPEEGNPNHPLPSHVHWFFWGLPVGHVWKASSGEHASLGGSIVWSNHLNWFTGHPGKETHFGCLCPWPYSFSHDPRLLAIDASWEVDWPVNRGSTCGSAPSTRQQIGFPSASLLKLLPSVWWSTSLFDPHSNIYT